MKNAGCLVVTCLALMAAGCSSNDSKTAVNTQTSGQSVTQTSGQAATHSMATNKPLPEWKSGFRVFVTNETSGDLSIIDGMTLEVLAHVPLGKRPRGIHASPDGKTIYVALSGSPIAPPGVDESKLPPPDKSADGIGVFDVAQNKLVRMLPGGSDPENFDLSRDGKTIYVSNEDAAGVSFIDVLSGKLLQTVHTGEEPEGVTLAPNGKLVYST